MILTHDEILKEMKKGRIKIEPFSFSQVGPASVDLHLGDEFRIFKKMKSLALDENTDYKKLSECAKKDKIIINPWQSILGITQEKITLPENICGWLEGRSRFARFGLQIHTTAGFIQPGINNKQVLEIANLSAIPLSIKSGLKVCQLVLEECKGKARYSGIFKAQKRP